MAKDIFRALKWMKLNWTCTWYQCVIPYQITCIWQKMRKYLTNGKYNFVLSFYNLCISNKRLTFIVRHQNDTSFFTKRNTSLTGLLAVLLKIKNEIYHMLFLWFFSLRVASIRVSIQKPLSIGYLWFSSKKGLIYKHKDIEITISF